MDLDISLDEADSSDDHSQPGSCGSYPGCESPGDGDGGDDGACHPYWYLPLPFPTC